MDERFQSAISVFRASDGFLRMADAVKSGISRKTLYAMYDAGVIERLSRGVYRLTSLPGLAAPDLITVAARAPNAVICLISALAFHELTTQIPPAVDIAVVRGSEAPRIDYPPVNVYWFSGRAFSEGITAPVVDGKKLRVYAPEKTITDVFKYRNKLGIDVALEALRAWRERRTSRIETLLQYARICRVERIILPYLEAMA